MQRRFALLLVLATAATLLGHLQPSARASRAVAYIPEPIPALAPDNVAQIFFMGPAGMRVRWDITAPGQYDSEPLVCPGRYNFPLGAIYRLMLYDIPGQANLVIYSDLEIAPPLPRTIEYLESNAVPVLLHDYDFVHAAAGEYLTKVIYVPDREMALESAQQGVETLTSTRLEQALIPLSRPTGAARSWQLSESAPVPVRCRCC